MLNAQVDTGKVQTKIQSTCFKKNVDVISTLQIINVVTNGRAAELNRVYIFHSRYLRNVRIHQDQLPQYALQSTFHQPPNRMDHTQAVLAGTESPTVQDFIEWHEEQAFRLGELGFTMGSYRDEDFFKQWADVSDLQEAFSRENCAQEAMEQLHEEAIRLQQRMIIMRGNPNLLAQTEIEVQRRLLQAGKSEPNIERYVKSKVSLRQKIVILNKLEHQTEPREPDGVTAWVYLGADLERKIFVNLPIKASLSEVCRLLEGIKKTEMPFLGYPPTGTQSVDAVSEWKYHLIDKNKSALVNKDPVRLLTDADYRKMIAQITRNRQDIKAPVAVMTLVGTRSRNLYPKQLTLSIGRSSRTSRTIEPDHRD